MIEKLLSYLEKRPRAVVAAALTFVLALSAVSGLCFYVLTIVVESERREAMRELVASKDLFEERSKILQERARLNSDHIVRLADTLVPILKTQADDVRKLKEQFEGRSKDDQTAPLFYAKLSEIEFRLMDLEQRLSAEKAIAASITPVTTASPLPSEWLKSYLLRWLTRWSAVIAAVSAVFLFFVLRKKREMV